MRIAVRLYIESKLVNETIIEAADLDRAMEETALRHFVLAGDSRQMTEMEFLDRPNDPERFARFGNWADPRMVEPMGVDLETETVGPLKGGRWTKAKLS